MSDPKSVRVIIADNCQFCGVSGIAGLYFVTLRPGMHDPEHADMLVCKECIDLMKKIPVEEWRPIREAL